MTPFVPHLLGTVGTQSINTMVDDGKTLTLRIGCIYYCYIVNVLDVTRQHGEGNSNALNLYASLVLHMKT